MKIISLFFFLLLYGLNDTSSQSFHRITEMQPDEEYDNIFTYTLATDSLSSSFLIWVKKEVKRHIHQRHTESIFILEGEGICTLGDKTVKIKAGDFLQVPAGTVHSVKNTGTIPIRVISVQSPEFRGDDRIFLD